MILTRLPIVVATLVALSAATLPIRPERPAPRAPARRVQRSTAPPAIVFVARRPPRGGAVPGLGPAGRVIVGEGRLLVRRADGTVRPLIEDGTFLDVSDPTVSFDGKRVAFAATPAANSPWRIYAVNADGTGLQPVTRTDRDLDLSVLGASGARFVRYDDIDPCWLPDGRIVFASTRYPQVTQIGDLDATNLFVVDPVSMKVSRITTERHGAEEPTIDPENGQIVYARWWFNRHLASEVDPSGVTLDTARAVPADAVNLWQAITTTPAGDHSKLAGGHPRVRAETMAYQPALFEDGTLAGVRAENLGMFPGTGRLMIQLFEHRFSEPLLVPAAGPGSACSPVPLPDGRMLFSYDAEGRGDYGLFIVRLDGTGLEKLLDLPETDELDATLLAPRKLPPVIQEMLDDLPRKSPVSDERLLRDSVTTFRFDCLNVFANAPVDAPFPDAPALMSDLRIRFYAALARPGAPGGDSVVLLRETPVMRSGAVHEHELPADTPMFEQLIDAHGKVLRSVMGPAHVPGFNSGRYGHGTKCVGCHIGHSAIPVAFSAHEGKRFNASPSAEVTASSVAPGSNARRAIDRRAKGSADSVAWVAQGSAGESLRLAWRTAIEVDTVVIYAIAPQVAEGTDLVVQELELAFFKDGQQVRVEKALRAIRPAGTRIACQGVRVDALEIRPTKVAGRVQHRPAVGLAEVETRARIVEGP